MRPSVRVSRGILGVLACLAFAAVAVLVNCSSPDPSVSFPTTTQNTVVDSGTIADTGAIAPPADSGVSDDATVADAGSPDADAAGGSDASDDGG